MRSCLSLLSCLFLDTEIDNNIVLNLLIYFASPKEVEISSSGGRLVDCPLLCT